MLRRKLSVFLAAALVSATMMLTMTAAPAFAFIHDFIPAGQCAASDQAGENDTAAEHLPVEEGQPIQRPPAPDDCPASQQ